MNASAVGWALTSSEWDAGALAAYVPTQTSRPHHGTATAWALPLAGAAQMRPGSALLTDLAAHAMITHPDVLARVVRILAREGDPPGASGH